MCGLAACHWSSTLSPAQASHALQGSTAASMLPAASGCHKLVLAMSMLMCRQRAVPAVNWLQASEETGPSPHAGAP